MKLRKSKRMSSKQLALQESWESILAKYPSTYGVKAKPLREVPLYRRETPVVPSLVVVDAEPCTKKDAPVYTGTNMLGIVVQHKSCLQPVFNQEEAKDSAKMRWG